MPKRVEFHQAEITVTVRIVDDERSYGARQFSLVLLMDTEQEWHVAREQVRIAIDKMQDQLDANSD